MFFDVVSNVWRLHWWSVRSDCLAEALEWCAGGWRSAFAATPRQPSPGLRELMVELSFNVEWRKVAEPNLTLRRKLA